MAIPPRVIDKIRRSSGPTAAAKIATKGGRSDLAPSVKAGIPVKGKTKRAIAAEAVRGIKPKRRRPDGRFG